MTASSSEILSTFVNEVSPRLLVDLLKQSHKDLMDKANAVCVYFDTHNVADWEFEGVEPVPVTYQYYKNGRLVTENTMTYTKKKDPVKCISFRPLRIRVLINKQLQPLQSEDWYKQQFQAGQRIYVSLNKERQICKDERINVLMIDSKNLREFEGNPYYRSVIRPVKYDDERSLQEKADQIIEDELPNAMKDFMLYLDARPEIVRQQKRGYIDKIRREVNKQYHTNINYDNAQKWIHKFRKEQPEAALTLMDKYKRAYKPKGDRKYYREAPKCPQGLYVRNHQHQQDDVGENWSIFIFHLNFLFTIKCRRNRIC